MFTLLFLFSLAIVLSSLWAVMALWFQVPGKMAVRQGLILVWSAVAMLLLVWLWHGWVWQSTVAYTAMFLLLRVWWASLKPSNDRDWADDLARTTHGSIQGDLATLHNVRNFNWRSEEDYDIRWETREYDLSRLRSLDMTTSYWSLPAIAHVLLSFGFDDGKFVVFSVEIRKEKQEKFSEIGGFFKKFELSIVATDERDALRVRTNVRGEDAYLYNTRLTDSDVRRLFVSFVEEANQLAATPRFYHSITANCTTQVFFMLRRIIGGLPLDVRLLLSGYLPAYVQKHRGLQLDYSLNTLKERGRITENAIAADEAEDFSWRIRQGVPGWEGETLSPEQAQSK